MRLDGNEALDDAVLRGLSDLTGDGLRAFEKRLPLLDPDRRSYMIAQMRTLALGDVETNFDAIFLNSLNDAEARVRAECALGLWESPLPTAITPLVGLLRNDPDQNVRAAAAQSLGHFLMLIELGQIKEDRRDEVYDALLRVVRHEPEESAVYQRALESVGYAGTEHVDFFLRSAVASDDAALRLAGVIGMGRSDDMSYQPLVRAELHHVSPHIRREAARATGELEDSDAVPALGELIDDPDTSVREAALESLAQIGGKDAKKLLEAVSASADEDLKAKADEALQLYEMLHGEFDFSMNLFDEESRTSFHSIRPEKKKGE